MKKLFALVAVAMLAATSFAQTEAGHFFFTPKFGLTNSSMYNAPNGYSTSTGIAVGVGGGYQVSDKFAITADALYSMQGAWADNIYGEDRLEKEVSIHNDYIIVPVMANYYILPGLAVKAGIQPGILVDGKWEEKYGGKETTSDAKDVMNKVDFSIPVGISYEYKNFILDARYTIGISDIYKEPVFKFDGEPGDYDPFAGLHTDKKNQKHGVIQITLGYKFQF